MSDVDQQAGKLRCIFENDIESRIYRQSLATRLVDEDGQIFAPRRQPEILTDDTVSGYTYVPAHKATTHKIADIVDRLSDTHAVHLSLIENTEKSPTYLMRRSKLPGRIRSATAGAAALENLVHRVFTEVRLNLTQVDAAGRNYDPSERFVFPAA